MPPDTLSTEKSESSSSLQLLNRSLHNSLPNITTDSNNNNNISIFKQLGSETKVESKRRTWCEESWGGEAKMCLRLRENTGSGRRRRRRCHYLHLPILPSYYCSSQLPFFFKIFSSLKILFSDLNLLILFSPQFFFCKASFLFSISHNLRMPYKFRDRIFSFLISKFKFFYLWSDIDWNRD